MNTRRYFRSWKFSIHTSTLHKKYGIGKVIPVFAPNDPLLLQREDGFLSPSGYSIHGAERASQIGLRAHERKSIVVRSLADNGRDSQVIGT